MIKSANLFTVLKRPKINALDYRMMKNMCVVADLLGAYLPGSSPQFMVCHFFNFFFPFLVFKFVCRTRVWHFISRYALYMAYNILIYLKIIQLGHHSYWQ